VFELCKFSGKVKRGGSYQIIQLRMELKENMDGGSLEFMIVTNPCHLGFGELELDQLPNQNTNISKSIFSSLPS